MTLLQKQHVLAGDSPSACSQHTVHSKAHGLTCSDTADASQDTLAELGILSLVPYLERQLSPCQQHYEQPQQPQQSAASQSPGMLVILMESQSQSNAAAIQQLLGSLTMGSLERA